MLREKNKDIPARLAKAKVFNGKLPARTSMVLVEPKLDGLRGIVLVRKSGVEAYTSNGLPVVNAAEICKLLALARKKIGYDFVLDGEFYFKDWNLSNSLVMTQSIHPEAHKLMLNAFDCIPYTEWYKKSLTMPLTFRRNSVAKIVNTVNSEKISLVKAKTFYYKDGYSEKRNKELLEEYALKKVSEGFEGVMIKLNTPYSFKRSNDWLKIKHSQDVDVKVVGVKLGKGKYHGLIGSLTCSFREGKKTISFNSSGMKDDLRKNLTDLYVKKKLIGRIVEVRHEGITINNKVRFPRFIRMREDKD